MKRVISAVVCTALLLSFGACGSIWNRRVSPLFEEVVTKTGDGYAFAGMDWSVTKPEAMRQLGVTAETAARDMDDRFTVAVHSDEWGIDGWATYVFIDKENPICTGRYYFPIEGGEDAVYRARLKEMAQTWLPEPEGGWTAWDQGSEYVTWNGENGSKVSIILFCASDGTLMVTLEVYRPPIRKEDLPVPPSD